MHDRIRTIVVGVMLMMVPGAIYAFSAFVQPLSVAFHWQPLMLATAFGLSLLSNGVAGSVGGVYVDKHGPRKVAVLGVGLIAGGDLLVALGTPHFGLPWFFLAFGVVGGAGCGLAYIAGISTVMRTQSRRFGFGAGLAALGFGLGSLVYGIVLRATPQYHAVAKAAEKVKEALDNAAVNGTALSAGSANMAPADVARLMGLFGGSALVVAVFGLALAGQLRTPEARAAEIADRTAPEVVGTMQWWFLWSIYFVATIAGGGIIGNSVAILHEITKLPAPSLTGYLVFLAASGCVGRVSIGAVVDHVGYRKMMSGALVLQAAIYFGLSFTHELHLALGLFAAAFFVFGGIVAMLTGWTAQSFGTRHIGAIWGLLTTGFGTAGLLGPWFLSAVHALNGTYEGALMPMGLMLALCAVLPAIMHERGDTRDLSKMRSAHVS